MSLHDRYNRGGGRLENLDRYLTDLGNRAGNAWHDRTGAGRHVLTQGLYLFSAWAALHHLFLFREPIMVAIVGLALFGMMGLTQSRGGLVEQIQVEALGLPRWSFAVLRLMILTAGLMALARGFGVLSVSLQTPGPIPFEVLEAFLHGGALVALQISEYIRRTNPPTISSGRGMGI